MKKFLFSIIAFTFAFGAKAQLAETPSSITPQERIVVTKPVEFHYGFKAGLNLTTYDSDCDDFQARFGQFGILCRWQFKNWAIQPELHYATMGVRSVEHMMRKRDNEADTWGTDRKDAIDFRLKMKMTTKNIQMPINFKWYLPIQSLHGINIQAGPTLSVQFNYDVSISGSPAGLLADPAIGIANGNKREFAHDMNRFTVLGNVGAGYDSPSGIGVDLRWCTGLTPVFKGEKQKAFTNCHDRLWVIAFTYVF